MKLKLGLFVKKNASTLLTGVGALGVVATAIISSYDREKYEENIKEKVRERHLVAETELERRDRIACLAKSYWRTALTIGVTEAAVIFSSRLDAKKIAALAAAATFAEDKLKKYRSVIAEKLGEEEEKQLYAESSEKEWHMSPSLPEGDDGELEYFYDEFSERFFKASVSRVQQAMYHLNRNFQLKGYVYLSEFYEFLGLPVNDLAKTIGWSDSYYLEEMGLTPWIDFYSQEKTAENGVKYHTIIYDIEPSVAAMRDWL